MNSMNNYTLIKNDSSAIPGAKQLFDYQSPAAGVSILFLLKTCNHPRTRSASLNFLPDSALKLYADARCLLYLIFDCIKTFKDKTLDYSV